MKTEEEARRLRRPMYYHSFYHEPALEYELPYEFNDGEILTSIEINRILRSVAYLKQWVDELENK